MIQTIRIKKSPSARILPSLMRPRLQHKSQEIFGLDKSSGMITAEFLFALIMICSFAVVFFSVTFTFTIVEIAQYVAFSASRAHAGAHIDPQKQHDLAEAKFKALMNNPIIKPLFNNGWFNVNGFSVKGGPRQGGDFLSDNYGTDDARRVPYIGVRFNFRAPIMEFQVPFLGKTHTDQNGFGSRLTGFLIREPTFVECHEQDVDRYNRIITLFPTIPGNETSKYNKTTEDNGC